MDLENYVVFDFESGTYFCAANAGLINWPALTEEQKKIMIEGSDTERILLADKISIRFGSVENEEEEEGETNN